MIIPARRGALQSVMQAKVVALLAVLFLNFVGLGLTFPIFPLYARSLGATGTIVGLLMTAFGLGEGVFAFVWGWVADEIGITKPLLIQMFGNVVLHIALALIPVLWVICFLRFAAAGLGSAVFATGRVFLARSLPPRSKGLAMALFTAMVAVGMSAGSFLGGILVERTGYASAFFMTAGVSLIAGVIVLTQSRTYQMPDEQMVDAGKPIASVSGADGASFVTWPVLILCLMVALGAIGSGAITTFLPLVITDVAGLGASEVGTIFGVPGVIGLFLILPLGRLSDRFGRRRVLVGALCFELVVCVGLSCVRTFWPILALYSVRSIGGWMMQPAVLALFSDVTPQRFQGRSQGMYVVAVDIGLVVGPVLAGVIWDAAGPQPTFLFSAALVSIALALACLVVREKEWQVRPAESASC